MSVGTAFHPATAPLNRKQQWREWSRLLRVLGLRRRPRHRVQRDPRGGRADRRQPALQVRRRRPRRAPPRRPGHHPRRDEADSPGRVFYTPWCDEHGKVIDDGTVHRLDDGTFRWTAADPQLRWLRMNVAGPRRRRSTTSSSGPPPSPLQGPLVARRPRGRDRRLVRRPAATSGAAARPSKVGRRKVAIDVSRTGYTGDLGYELWVDADDAVALWDALWAAGAAYGIRPAGHARARRRPARGRA